MSKEKKEFVTAKEGELLEIDIDELDSVRGGTAAYDAWVEAHKEHCSKDPNIYTRQCGLCRAYVQMNVGGTLQPYCTVLNCVITWEVKY